MPRKLTTLGLLTFSLSVLSSGFADELTPPGQEADSIDLADGLYATLDTTRGPITVRLYSERAPLTVANFVGLAEGALNQVEPGTPYYDGLTFHRVVPGFVIQGGDPKGTGSGGPGYSFQDEFDPTLRHDRAGILSMANSGPNSNGSQFFVTLGPTPHLDYLHSVFGEVVSGIDNALAIEADDLINSVQITRQGSEANAFVVDAQSFEQLRASTRIVPRAQYLINKSQEDYPDGRVAWVNQKLFSHAQVTGRPVLAVVMDDLGSDREATDNWEEMINDYGVREDGALILVTLDPRKIRLWIGENQLGNLPLPEVEPGMEAPSDHDRLHAAKQALLEPCYELLDTRAPQSEFRALMAALSSVLQIVDADLVEPSESEEAAPR